MCSSLADSVGLLLRLGSARFQCTGHSFESLVREMVSLVADLLCSAVSRSAYIVGSLKTLSSAILVFPPFSSLRVAAVAFSFCLCLHGAGGCGANLEGLGAAPGALKKVYLTPENVSRSETVGPNGTVFFLRPLGLMARSRTTIPFRIISRVGDQKR